MLAVLRSKTILLRNCPFVLFIPSGIFFAIFWKRNSLLSLLRKAEKHLQLISMKKI